MEEEAKSVPVSESIQVAEEVVELALSNHSKLSEQELESE